MYNASEGQKCSFARTTNQFSGDIEQKLNKIASKQTINFSKVSVRQADASPIVQQMPLEPVSSGAV